MWLCVIVLAAGAGGLLGIKLKLPAGAMLGAIFAVAAVTLAFNRTYPFPTSIRFVTQVSTGTFIGAKIRRSDLEGLRRVFLPAVILTVVMVSFALGAGLLLAKASGLSAATALFATAPAGITDMTLASQELGANSAMVAVLQIVRLLSVLSIMPGLIRIASRRLPKTQSHAPTVKQTVHRGSPQEIIQTLLVGSVCGYAGRMSGIPAATISFAMVGCAAFSVGSGRAYMPQKLRWAIQMLGGAYIGVMITRAQVAGMLAILPAVLYVIAAFILLNFLAAFFLVKLGGMDPLTALYSSASGGLTDMALIADEMGADSAQVATMQLVRVMAVIMLYPAIIGFLLS